MRRIAALIALLALAVPAHAEATNPGTALAPLFVALGIAYVTRRMAIGGWLFYYYLGLYVSAPIMVLSAVASFTNLQPSGWEDKALYAFVVLSYIPWFLAFTLNLIFSTRLLFKSQRNEKNTKIVRYVLLALVITSAAGVVIDYIYFPEDVPLDILSLISSSIWCLYFFFSKRVKYVLARWTGEWNYDAFKSNQREAQRGV